MSTAVANSRKRSPLEMGIMVGIFAFFLLISLSLIPRAPHDVATNFCEQITPLTPPGEWRPSSWFSEDDAYRNKSLEALQGAIRVPTQSFDDMAENVADDPRFAVFAKLHQHVKHTFPLAWKYSETVNEYGLLFTIRGSDKTLKPVVLMAHQDVVPVNAATEKDWDYPPFSAEFDGEWIHGRGAADTKNTMIAILEATEALLEQGWTPSRTLILSFGFDEEVSGYRGARYLASTLLERYGPDSVEIIVDEGFGSATFFGARIAAVMIGEKGYTDVKVTLEAPGGHSSQPPDHTSIGIMAELLRELEMNPFASSLDNSNPTLSMFRCLAEHAPHMPQELKRTVLDIDHGNHRKALIELIDSNPQYRYLIRTSQAIDVIHGGVKVNALPEQVEATINHRIAIDTSSSAVIDRVESHVEAVAQRHGLGAISLGETLLDSTGLGFFNLSVVGKTLEPAPLAPTAGSAWSLLAGTTRNVLGDDVVVAPAIFPANTDTRHYWNLTRGIYRFSPVLFEDMVNYHTVNERLRFRSHIMSVQWFYEFILNANS